MSLMPDANSLIISTEHSLLWWLKGEIRLCNSPVVRGYLPFDRSRYGFGFIAVGAVILSGRSAQSLLGQADFDTIREQVGC